MPIETTSDATREPTMRCECGGELIMEESNGVVDPDRMRWELYNCAMCGKEGTYVMLSDGDDYATGCIDI